jgi:hypothetical protein
MGELRWRGTGMGDASVSGAAASGYTQGWVPIFLGMVGLGC